MGKILPVTMADVGRAAGVSHTAVSLALRNDPSIPPSTRKRILAAVRKLGYRPHAGISSLMAQIRSNRPVTIHSELAAITQWPEGAGTPVAEAWREQWLGARRRAEQLGYMLEEFWIGDGKLTPRRLDAILHARNIDGLVIFPSLHPQTMDLAWENYTATAIGFSLEAPQIHRVVTAHFDAVLIALGQLRKRGYRRIGLVIDEHLSWRVRRNWEAAFWAFAHEHGNVAPSAIATFPQAQGGERLGPWLKQYRPDAILCAIAFPLRSWLTEHGWRVPEDIGLAGLATMLPGEGCACVDEKWQDVGAAAVDFLVGQMRRGERGVPRRPMVTLIRGEWVEGDSVRPPTSP
ncbi:MAG TPA: LacI family DNA-binding transcriptional regulator [Opitutaceae bacterium]